jgi:hypothetical protein
MPKGYRTVLVLADGTVAFFGHEQDGRATDKVLALQTRVSEQGIEPTALASSEDGRAWVLIGIMPSPGCRARAVEEQLGQLLRKGRMRAPRRRRRRHRGRGTARKPHNGGESGAAA